MTLFPCAGRMPDVQTAATCREKWEGDFNERLHFGSTSFRDSAQSRRGRVGCAAELSSRCGARVRSALDAVGRQPGALPVACGVAHVEGMAERREGNGMSNTTMTPAARKIVQSFPQRDRPAAEALFEQGRAQGMEEERATAASRPAAEAAARISAQVATDARLSAMAEFETLYNSQPEAMRPVLTRALACFRQAGNSEVEAVAMLKVSVEYANRVTGTPADREAALKKRAADIVARLPKA
jgi:hypothetical protein